MGRFVSYLVALAIMLLALWIIFAGFILPALPGGLKGFLMILAFASVLVAVAIAIIAAYERD